MKINDFLKKIAKDIETKNRNLEADDFYYILKYLGVKKDSSLAPDIESFYQSFLDSLNDSLVKYEHNSTGTDENTTHYLGFYVDRKANYLNAVKVYFPVKYEYMISTLKSVFVYLVRNNISSVVKFHLKATNENIVIRFYQKEDVLPFINYCKNNFVLDDLLGNPHPFLATNNGFGIAYDDNFKGSYNSTLSMLLAKYFESVNANLSFNRVSDLDFLDYIIHYEETVSDEVMLFNIKAVENNIRTILLKGEALH